MSMEDPHMFAGKAMYQILQIISFNFRESSESFNSAQLLSSFQLVPPDLHMMKYLDVAILHVLTIQNLRRLWKTWHLAV
jgi:hypothetical protein